MNSPPHYILEDKFQLQVYQAKWLRVIPRVKWLNYLQTVLLKAHTQSNVAFCSVWSGSALFGSMLGMLGKKSDWGKRIAFLKVYCPLSNYLDLQDLHPDLKYHIRPNYRTVHLGFSKLPGTLICGKICIYLLRIHYKKDQKKTYLMTIMHFFLIFFIKVYVVGTHLNCIDKSMQFKWVSTTYAFIKE